MILMYPPMCPWGQDAPIFLTSADVTLSHRFKYPVQETAWKGPRGGSNPDLLLH